MLNAELHATNYTAATTVSTRLGTDTPSATVNMTELTGTGYTAGGTVMTFNAASAAATSNSVYRDVDERVGRHLVDRVAGDLGERGNPAAAPVGDVDRAAHLCREHKFVSNRGSGRGDLVGLM